MRGLWNLWRNQPLAFPAAPCGKRDLLQNNNITYCDYWTVLFNILSAPVKIPSSFCQRFCCPMFNICNPHVNILPCSFPALPMPIFCHPPFEHSAVLTSIVLPSCCLILSQCPYWMNQLQMLLVLDASKMGRQNVTTELEKEEDNNMIIKHKHDYKTET